MDAAVAPQRAEGCLLGIPHLPCRPPARGELHGYASSYNKSYSRYQQDDGSYTFVRNNNLGMEGELSVDQNVWLTGGKLSLTTSLSYIRQLNGNKQQQFMNVPSRSRSPSRSSA